MKIISVVSSGRKDGNTSRIATIFERELVSAGERNGVEVRIERVMPASLDIKMCRGCRACFDKGETCCPLKDDLLSLKQKLDEADGFLFGSPVYVEDVNGVMKNLIDRLAFLSHRPGFPGKTAFLFVTSGLGSSSHSIRTMSTALGTWGCLISGSLRFRAGALTKTEELQERYAARIRKSADRFFYDIQKKRFTNPSWFSLIAFRVQQACWKRESTDKSSVDYRYWEDKGWLENGCRYYFKHRANPVKAGLCRAGGKIAAIFFA